MVLIESGSQCRGLETARGAAAALKPDCAFTWGYLSRALMVDGQAHAAMEAIDRAVKRQIGQIAHSTFLGLTHPPAVELARKLLKVVPKNLTRVFYSDSGAASVEVALKMAYQSWQQRGAPRKRLFVTFENAYHGDTVGSVSVGGIDLFHAAYRPLLFKTLAMPSPYCYRCPLSKTYPSCRLACLAPLEKVLRERADEIAAVVVEPGMQAASGLLVEPKGWLARIRELVGFLIRDELDQRHAVLRDEADPVDDCRIFL